jgi:ATP-dependent helicase/nuclease subunit A
MLKSLIVAAPAGSGKTEELSRRYIELLKQGVEPERILTLTFTDKAAAEMKERILKRLRDNHPALYRKVRENILRLRISTIHSFCLSLLRRFAPHIGLDPTLEALDDAGSAGLWNRALYDTLARIAAEPSTSGDYRTLMNLVTRDKSQTWGRLTEQFATLYKKRTAVEHAVPAPLDEAKFAALGHELRADPEGPALIPGYKDLFPLHADPAVVTTAVELMAEHQSTFLTQAGTPRKQRLTPEQRDLAVRLAEYRQLLLTKNWYAEFGRMFDLFRRQFLATYDKYKREASAVDFTDMERSALRIITEDEQWQNILYAFDEQTDHLLVDEFQDTSYIQWAIVRKLTEEWLSGEGAKTDRGIEPTIFIVGDVKQSIYLFRDAKVEVFAAVRGELRAALGDRLEEKHIEYNYRSLQSIIDFSNTLFARLMAATGDSPQSPWRTLYEPFLRGRQNDAPGRVEILLDRNEGNMEERRRAEAEMLCRRIQSLIGTRSEAQSPGSEVSGALAGPSPLLIYDRDPGGSETARPCECGDIAILLRKRTHLDYFTDALCRNGIPYIAVGGTGFYAEPEVSHLKSLLSFLVDPADSFALYALLRGPLFALPERDLLLANSEPGRLLWDRLQAYAQKRPSLALAVVALRSWLGRVNRQKLAGILEQALSERRAWTIFWEPQRVANIRKFLHVIETMELEGQHPLRILEYLDGHPDERRADVSVETSGAVQIVTVHGAKGLQFPVVFYPECELPPDNNRGDSLLIEERAPQQAWVSFIPDSGIRKTNDFHAEFADKEAEEEKRVFYVACTRATDALFLSGIWRERRGDSPLSWLEEHLGLEEDGHGFRLKEEIPGVHCLTARDIPAAAPAPALKKQPKPPVRTAPITPEPAPSIRAVTRNLASDFQRHGEDSIGLGEIIHKLLEEVSNGTLTADRQPLTAEIQRLLRLNGLDVSLSTSIESTVHSLVSNVPLWDIIKAQPNSFAELPIMYRDADDMIHTGRIDRVIVTDGEARVYDYKTFKVTKKDIPELAHEYYEGQLKYYEEAVRKLYPDRKVSSFLIFTAIPFIVPAGG